MPIERIQRERVGSRVVQPANIAAQRLAGVQAAAAQPSEAEKILNSLSQFAGIAAETSMREVKRKVELDKIEQTNRAVQDLAKPTEDRMGISDEATRGGQQAYQLVMARKALSEANVGVMNSINENPNMSDDEFNEMQRTHYEELLTQYEDSPDVMKYLSSAAQEGQIEVHANRKLAKLKFQHSESVTAVSDRLNALSVESNPETISSNVDEWKQEAEALGFNEEAQRDAMLQQAQTLAYAGDDTLLSYIEEQPWASKEDSVRVAREAYVTKKTREGYIGQAGAMDEVNALVGQPQVSWEQIESNIVSANGGYPNTYSGPQVAAIKNKHRILQAKAAETNALVNTTFNANSLPLSKQGDITPKDRKAIIKNTELIFSEMAATMSPDELRDAKLSWSQHNEVKLPSLTTQFQAIGQLVPDRELTESDKLSMNLIAKAREEDIQFYLGGADAEYAINIKKEMERSGEPQRAIMMATERKLNRFNVTTATRNTVRDEVTEGLSSQFSHFFDSDVPDWQALIHGNQLFNDIADTRLYLGGDADGMGDKIAQEQQVNYTQLDDGTVMNVPIAQLYEDLGYSADTNPDVVKKALQSVQDSLEADMTLRGYDKGDYMLYRTEAGYSVRTKEGELLEVLFTGASLRMEADKIDKKLVEAIAADVARKRATPLKRDVLDPTKQKFF